jgi:hypothetical protein
VRQFEFSFVKTPNRGVLMVANFEFDGFFGFFKRSIDKMLESRKALGRKLGSVTLSLDPLSVPRGGGNLGKRGPNPNSADVLNLPLN